MKKRLLLGLVLMMAFSMTSCGLLEDISTTTTTKQKPIETTTNTTTKQPIQTTTISTTTEIPSSTTQNVTKYIITFDSNGGSDISSLEIEKGQKAVKPTDPTKDGYTFGGWYTSKYYFVEYNFNDTVTKDLTLYAKWNKIPKTVLYEIGTPTVDIWTNSIGSKWMKIAIPVTNTGTADLYMGSCTADIENESGSLLQTVSYINCYPDYIKPGETGYYYEETTCDFNNTNAKVVPHIEIEEATNDVIRYEISDVSINSDLYNGIKILGRVENKTSKKGSLVILSASLFNSNGNLICNCFTYLDNELKVNDKVGFTLTTYAYDDIKPEDVASYEIYAYPTQFNL